MLLLGKRQGVGARIRNLMMIEKLHYQISSGVSLLVLLAIVFLNARSAERTEWDFALTKPVLAGEPRYEGWGKLARVKLGQAAIRVEDPLILGAGIALDDIAGGDSAVSVTPPVVFQPPSVAQVGQEPVEADDWLERSMTVPDVDAAVGWGWLADEIQAADVDVVGRDSRADMNVSNPLEPGFRDEPQHLFRDELGGGYRSSFQLDGGFGFED